MIEPQDLLRIAQLAGCTENHLLRAARKVDAPYWTVSHDVVTGDSDPVIHATFSISDEAIHDLIPDWHEWAAYYLRQWHHQEFHCAVSGRTE